MPGGADLILKTQNLATKIGVKLLLGVAHVILNTHNLSIKTGKSFCWAVPMLS